MADAQSYRKLSHREHVLQSPGMYIGSILPEVMSAWVVSLPDIVDNNVTMTFREDLTVCPGLLKIIDEIMVNAVDHSVRSRLTAGMTPVKRIDIVISEDHKSIEVSNDGDPIPVEKHAEHADTWVPELIFGHMLTSANYDTTDRIVGGQNGIGAKACNIFSRWFEVEVIDSVRRLHYTQRFEDNMSITSAPKVVPSKAAKSKTVIRFLPDYTRFGIADDCLTNDMYALVLKRAVDLTAVTHSDVSVWLNGRKLGVKSFERYTDLYGLSGRIYERINDAWEVAVSLHNKGTSCMHVSFVNGLATLRGGKHVDHIAAQISRRLCDMIASRLKGSSTPNIRPQFVKDSLILFIRATIPSPTFDSQSKEFLTTLPSKFGQKVELSDGFIEKLYKLPGLVDHIVAMSGAAASRDAARKTDGSKRSNIHVPKLDDAEWAGTGKSDECTLILTEGDSAKASAVAGLSVVGRQRYGVFPLRGKVMNVCDVGIEKVAANAEISAVKKILGLQNGRDYTSTKELRYGRVMLMTDADLDGSHIKGLVMNLFAQLWPSLLRIDGFIVTLRTPVIKAWLPNTTTTHEFYQLGEFESWVSGLPEDARKKLRSKYYKGLGTSTAEEARDWFKRMHITAYTWHSADCKEAFSKAFDKKRADDRKTWLQSHTSAEGGTCGETGAQSVSFADFIDHELVHFSNYDVLRSIPSVVDGLKVSQRKALFGCRKRGASRDEVRVAQLAAYVSEHSCFHHGESSMQGTLIGLAQAFVGSGNNVPLLEAIGQFGTRLNGGSDAASPRYIHTRLSHAALKLFPKEDDVVLDWLEDDGIAIEPRYYLPVLPVVLMNGASGIGTGYSTTVPSFNPLEVWKAVRLWIDQHETGEAGADGPSDLLQVPWHHGFTGDIEIVDRQKGRSRGRLSFIGSTRVRVTELPIGMWTEDFKEALVELIDRESDIKSFTNESTESTIDFVIQFASVATAKAWMETAPGQAMTRLEMALRMTTSKGLGLTNMHLFDVDGNIKRYNSPWDVVCDYAKVRLDGYVRRRAHVLKHLAEEIDVLADKARFIEGIICDKIDLKKKSDSEVEDILTSHGFHRDKATGTFDHLLDMPMSSMTLKRKAVLDDKLHAKQADSRRLEQMTPSKMWIEELESLLPLLQEIVK